MKYYLTTICDSVEHTMLLPGIVRRARCPQSPKIEQLKQLFLVDCGTIFTLFGSIQQGFSLERGPDQNPYCQAAGTPDHTAPLTFTF